MMFLTKYIHVTVDEIIIFEIIDPYQSGRSPKVVALFSATNYSSHIIKFLQLHNVIQIKWNYTRIHYNTAKRSLLMI